MYLKIVKQKEPHPCWGDDYTDINDACPNKVTFKIEVSFKEGVVKDGIYHYSCNSCLTEIIDNINDKISDIVLDKDEIYEK